MNLDSLNLVELNAHELKEIEGGCEGCDMIGQAAKAVGNAIVETGKWVGGLLTGLGDGIREGIKDGV
jgi:hypothetical protein